MSKVDTKLVALHILAWGALLGLPWLFTHTFNQHIDSVVHPHDLFTVSHILDAVLFYLNAYWMYPLFFTKGMRWQYGPATLILIGIFFYLKILLLQLEILPSSLDFSLVPILLFSTVMFMLISIVYRMVVDSRKIENEQLKMELKFLRSQINPHFLFNVLNNIVSMARNKSDQLESSLIKLSGLMRYILYESGDKKISLAKEVEYLKSFIELQKIRFSDAVPIRVRLPHVNSSHRIEPMLLIPFVENAFKHGIDLIEDPNIDISLWVVNNTLFFKVLNKFRENSNKKDETSGIGINNVIKRLKLLYPNQHQIEITNKDSVYKVELKLALK